jgi:hypothetical protein
MRALWDLAYDDEDPTPCRLREADTAVITVPSELLARATRIPNLADDDDEIRVYESTVVMSETYRRRKAELETVETLELSPVRIQPPTPTVIIPRPAPAWPRVFGAIFIGLLLAAVVVCVAVYFLVANGYLFR